MRPSRCSTICQSVSIICCSSWLGVATAAMELPALPAEWWPCQLCFQQGRMLAQLIHLLHAGLPGCLQLQRAWEALGYELHGPDGLRFTDGWLCCWNGTAGVADCCALYGFARSNTMHDGMHDPHLI